MRPSARIGRNQEQDQGEQREPERSNIVTDSDTANWVSKSSFVTSAIGLLMDLASGILNILSSFDIYTFLCFAHCVVVFEPCRWFQEQLSDTRFAMIQ